MKIAITYDYELFFGEVPGSAEKCILHPTNDLIALAAETGAAFTFFIDVGYLKKLREFKVEFPELEKDYEAICAQLQDLIRKNHACELHIHPHWEDSFYKNGKWNMVVDRYKLSDFTTEEAEKIITEYYSILAEITNQNPTCYRAGGWCLQPFEYANIFRKLNLKIDSTVFKGGHFEAGNYFYDFRKTPDKESWKITSDICEEDTDGATLEIPIASQKYSPLFFWKLFILGRLNPNAHKPIGDGIPMSSPGLRKQMLTQGKLLCTSVDGYFVTKIEKALRIASDKNTNSLVIIGHPKANTKFALKKLNNLIRKHHKEHSFVSLPSLINEST